MINVLCRLAKINSRTENFHNKTNVQHFQLIFFNIFTFKFLDDLCYLPDGLTQAKCERLHRCAFFMDQIKPFGSGKLPQNLITDIYAHVCGNNNVCEKNIPKVSHTYNFNPFCLL